MVLDLDRFVQKINSVVNRNRMIYNLSEFLAILFCFLVLFIFFDLPAFFKHIPFTEPYVGLSPLPLLEPYVDLSSVPFLGAIHYEIIFSFFIVCILTVLFLKLLDIVKQNYHKKVLKTTLQKTKATTIVEHFYPQLKDRLNTAVDNKNNNSVVAVDLKSSVTQDVDTVTTFGLVDQKRVVYSFAIIFISGIFLIALLFTGYTSPVTPEGFFNKTPNGTIKQPDFTPSEENSSGSYPTDVSPISPEPGIDIDVTLPPGAGAGPGDMLEDNEGSMFEPSEYFPPESLSSHHYYELLPEGYEDVIKDYFERLAEHS